MMETVEHTPPFRVEDVSFESGGKLHKGKKVIHPGAAVILPMREDGCPLLIRNYRFVVGDALWELPAGTLDAGESAIETARRELIEETGYEAQEILPLVHFYSSPGFCDEEIHGFVAHGLRFVGQALMEDEDITVHPVPFVDILSMIHEGDIRDAKTIAILLYYYQFREA